MQIGCALPAGTFMPESKAAKNADGSPDALMRGYDSAMKMGYSYAEACVSAIMALTDDAFDMLASSVSNGVFRLLACNSFVPPSLPVCTSEESELASFVQRVMRRMDRLDVRTVVFGSGVARMIPPDMPRDEGMERMKRFLSMCSACGKPYGITTAIEPLNATETNVFNTLRDAAECIDVLSCSNIRLLPDLFHMSVQGEDPSALQVYSEYIVHIHASEAPGRVYPGKYGGAYLQRCADMLRKCLWNGNITVECVFRDFLPEADRALRFMKEYYLWDFR